jgi:hypothetical protein
MSEQRMCTCDSGPPTDGTVGPTYSEGDEVSDPVGRAEAPNIVGPSLLRHGQSQHSGSATFSTTKELSYSAKSANSGDRKQDKPISPNQAKKVYICVTTDEPMLSPDGTPTLLQGSDSRPLARRSREWARREGKQLILCP